MDNPYQAPASGAAPTRPGDPREFRDASQLTAACRWLVYASIAVSLVSIALSLRELDLLRQAGEGVIDYTESEDAIALQSLLLVPLLLVIVASYVVVGMWIHRMASNAWALTSSRPLEYRPRWAWGWYFIPIANIWKPYQAMKEIWQASSDPLAPARAKVPWLFPAWWTIWLAHNFTSNIAGRLAWRADSADDSNMAAIVSIVSDALNIPLCLVFLAIVVRLQQTQERRGAASEAGHATRPAEMAFSPASDSPAPSPPH